MRTITLVWENFPRIGKLPVFVTETSNRLFVLRPCSLEGGAHLSDAAKKLLKALNRKAKTRTRTTS